MGFARLLLEQPIVARGGDRFVVRKFLAGDDDWGRLVLDPFPPKRPRVAERGLAVQQPGGERLARLVGGKRACAAPRCATSRCVWASCQERSPRPSNKPGRV